MSDPFGNPITDTASKTHSPQQRWKAAYRYREHTISHESCKTCANLRERPYHGKMYRKCLELGESHGPATDIALRNVCDLWRTP